MDVFDKAYKPLVEAESIESFDLYTLTDAAEQDDHCANIYHKSLLYLVSAAFEQKPRIPGIRDGIPILGMAKFAEAIPKTFWRANSRNWFKAPGGESQALHHGDFDNDGLTLRSTLARITGKIGQIDTTPASQTMLRTTVMAQRRRRAKLDTALRLMR